ncbi:hypothetical protein IE53DRAFT_408489 [Violaceomyces palustris]|uniref:Uncharacterized protein n=1 Tax=Violaceomyces palustris TaxID=1673888 RepID=A0ACD0P6L2_9BASI|nr:hypothetical protein IE53DRAFT_408489 [Violaceomyces palustris]
MNPNARSFAFNPNASGFVPPGQQQQQGQQGQQGQPGQPYQQYYQQGFAPQQGFNGAYQQPYQQQQQPYSSYQQQGFNQAYTQQGFTNQPQQAGAGFQQNQQPYQPRGGYQQQNRQYSSNNNNNNNQANSIPSLPQASGLPPNPAASSAASTNDAPRKPVSLSIGGGAAKPPATDDAPRKPVSLSIGGGAKPSVADDAPRKPVSLSIGGGAKPAEKKPVSISIGAGAKKAEAAAPSTVADKETPAAAGGVAAVKAAESASASTASSPPASRSESPAPAPANSGTATPSSTSGATVKKATKAPVGQEKSSTNAERVLEEAKKATDEETLKDLFGDKSEDLKSHLNVVFIGHVDAGKSTMGGNLLYLTGMVDKRTLEKYEKEAKEAGRESWYLSWALDSTPQEREKGKTVEVGRAYFETGKRRYTILDAPGHKSYVPHMISGAAQADIAILVISARRGEFETGFERGGQTREHAMLVKTAGVQRLVVVINKMDDSTVNWEKERYDEIVSKLTPFLRSAGFNPKTDLTFVPVSAYSGHNLKEKVPESLCPWYKGPPLLTFLDNLALGDRKISEPLKMPISEKYSDMGTVVVGKLESGKIKKGDSLMLMPNKTSVEAVAIFNEMEEEVPAAISGDNVRVKIKGIDHEDVNVGYVLTDPTHPVHVVTRFEAQLAILEHRNIICAGYSAVMHCHTVSEEVSLSALLHYYDKKTGKKSRKGPQFAKKGMKIIALIEAAGPICLERFKDYPQLGRFTLRDEGKTIAGSKITKTS